MQFLHHKIQSSSFQKAQTNTSSIYWPTQSWNSNRAMRQSKPELDQEDSKNQLPKHVSQQSPKEYISPFLPLPLRTGQNVSLWFSQAHLRANQRWSSCLQGTAQAEAVGLQKRHRLYTNSFLNMKTTFAFFTEIMAFRRLLLLFMEGDKAVFH